MLAVLLLAAAHGVLASFDTANLFPIAVSASFSTAPVTSGLPTGISLVALDDSALRVHNVTKNVTHNVVSAPDAPEGTQAWQALYAQGSWNPTGTPRGGFGFYMTGPEDFDFTSVQELLFSYAVYFPANFQFNMGGKLPGPYGGTTEELANRCSGGRQSDRDQCFDLRLMWRTSGAGEIYAYLPEDPANNALRRLSGTVVDDSFGTSIARGAFSFNVGGWTVVAQRVKLNTPGKADGELELFVDGKSVIHATGVLMRKDASSVFRGGHIQTFFGGNTADWASPVDQQSLFADFSAGVVKPGASPADGQAPYPINASYTGASQRVAAPIAQTLSALAVAAVLSALGLGVC